MRITGWIIGCTECKHAAIARMPLTEARREAHRHGWQRRQHGAEPCWICPYCAGYRLPTQERLPATSEGRMRTELLTQIGDWPGEPVSCCLHCPNPACAAQATMLLATPGQADLRCPSSGAEVTRTLVRAGLLPHAEQTG